jgi:hypothetical protein
MRITNVLVVGILFAVGILFIGTSSAAEPVTVKGMTQNELVEYVKGMAKGMSHYHLGLLLDGKPQLFCSLHLNGIGALGVWNLINASLSGPFRDTSMFGPAVIRGLQDKYPCKGK